MHYCVNKANSLIVQIPKKTVITLVSKFGSLWDRTKVDDDGLVVAPSHNQALQFTEEEKRSLLPFSPVLSNVSGRNSSSSYHLSLGTIFLSCIHNTAQSSPPVLCGHSALEPWDTRPISFPTYTYRAVQKWGMLVFISILLFPQGCTTAGYFQLF